MKYYKKYLNEHGRKIIVDDNALVLRAICDGEIPDSVITLLEYKVKTEMEKVFNLLMAYVDHEIDKEVQ